MLTLTIRFGLCLCDNRLFCTQSYFSYFVNISYQPILTKHRNIRADFLKKIIRIILILIRCIVSHIIVTIESISICSYSSFQTKELFVRAGNFLVNLFSTWHHSCLRPSSVAHVNFQGCRHV